MKSFQGLAGLCWLFCSCKGKLTASFLHNFFDHLRHFPLMQCHFTTCIVMAHMLIDLNWSKNEMSDRLMLRPRCLSIERTPAATRGPEAKASAQRNKRVAQQTELRKAQTGDLSTSMGMKTKTRRALAINHRKT